MFKENALEIQLKRKQTTSHKFGEKKKLTSASWNQLYSPSLDETPFGNDSSLPHTLILVLHDVSHWGGLTEVFLHLKLTHHAQLQTLKLGLGDVGSVMPTKSTHTYREEKSLPMVSKRHNHSFVFSYRSVSSHSKYCDILLHNKKILLFCTFPSNKVKIIKGTPIIIFKESRYEIIITVNCIPCHLHNNLRLPLLDFEDNIAECLLHLKLEECLPDIRSNPHAIGCVGLQKGTHMSKIMENTYLKPNIYHHMNSNLTV